MKTLLSILLSLCLAACVTPEPVKPAPPLPPEPPEPPVVVVPTGTYLITKFNQNGIPIQTWETDSIEERSFPKRVTFESDGQTITLDGSFQVDRKLR